MGYTWMLQMETLFWDFLFASQSEVAQPKLGLQLKEFAPGEANSFL